MQIKDVPQAVDCQFAIRCVVFIRIKVFAFDQSMDAEDGANKLKNPGLSNSDHKQKHTKDDG